MKLGYKIITFITTAFTEIALSAQMVFNTSYSVALEHNATRICLVELMTTFHAQIYFYIVSTAVILALILAVL